MRINPPLQQRALLFNTVTRDVAWSESSDAAIVSTTRGSCFCLALQVTVRHWCLCGEGFHIAEKGIGSMWGFFFWQEHWTLFFFFCFVFGFFFVGFFYCCFCSLSVHIRFFQAIKTVMSQIQPYFSVIMVLIPPVLCIFNDHQIDYKNKPPCAWLNRVKLFKCHGRWVMECIFWCTFGQNLKPRCIKNG